MTATLRSRSAPELGPGGRRVRVDCRHGTTTADLFTPATGGPLVSEAGMIALAVERHERAEGCRCARGLATLARSRRGGLTA